MQVPATSAAVEPVVAPPEQSEIKPKRKRAPKGTYKDPRYVDMDKCTCDAKAQRAKLIQENPKGSAFRKRKISHDATCVAWIEHQVRKKPRAS